MQSNVHVIQSRASNPTDAHVLTFCRGISSATPISVQVQAIGDEPRHECLIIVPKHVAAHGGEQVLGWAIWEWPRVFIEAEFHCVWRSPHGELVDLSPRAIDVENITFLPDPERKYRGRQIDNIRKPLRDGLLVRRFIAAAEARFRAMNEGDLADYHGPVAMTPKMLDLEHRVHQLREKLYLRYRWR